MGSLYYHPQKRANSIDFRIEKELPDDTDVDSTGYTAMNRIQSVQIGSIVFGNVSQDFSVFFFDAPSNITNCLTRRRT